MSFATPTFLWFFMPTTLLCYWVLPRAARNGVVAVASLVFYAWGGHAFVFLLLACVAVNFAVGLALGSPRPALQRRRKAALITAIVVDVGALAVWKYADFGSRQISALSRAFGGHDTHVLHLVLPIGISFFTFHHLSYVVDVYRGSRKPLRNPLTFVTYIMMFPQLIAGPIVRFHEIADQLEQRPSDRLGDFAAGFPRFALGLSKKVVVADTIAPVANSVFALHTSELTTVSAWLGALAYTLQLYFDFSGYSDMAIGLGRMFGFQLPENFNRPYSAASITDFWRRWHMSLSRWFRDYLYIPLGGNRGSRLQTYRNLYIVFALTGFWHGANWTFLVWGLYHGTLLVIERVTGWGDPQTAWRPLQRAATQLLVIVGWVLFRADSLPRAGHILGAMFVPTGHGLPLTVSTALTHRAFLVFVLALIVFLLPRDFVMGRFVEFGTSRSAIATKLAYVAVVAPVAAALVAVGTFSPFLYYQF
ncbi:MAG: alginate O-acetyltransferase complex protein AlgI [Actinomycetota bacterium]|nr:alginate O-acetyltransferase complex protein AlgI [Actinomycetota bacterium]